MKAFIILLAGIVMAGSAAGDESLSLWYQKPANPKKWEESVPLGNGRLGAMVGGGVDQDIMILNEDTLWSGWAEPDNDREGSFEVLREIRQLLKEQGDQKRVKELALEKFCSLHGYGKPDFGAYQSFCNAVFEFGHDPESVTKYRRDLDLETAIATVSYSLNGVDYDREYFCSYPDNVLVVRFTASQKKKISFTLGASSLHKEVEVVAGKNSLTLNGQITTGNQGHPGMKFQSVWKVGLEGGAISKNATGDRLIVKNADSVTLVMSGATNYRMEYPDYKGAAPDKRNQFTLKKVATQSFETLRETHIADYRKLFNRVELELGGTSRSDLPTMERLAAYKKNRDDRGLETLLFQYGRYLLISSSRPGCMPANLQGLWNKSNKPPWMCDYHLNINFQMNYWPVNLCNLAECAEPMIEWTRDVTRPGAKSAKTHYNARGWVVHHSANAWGYTPPGPKRGIHMLEAESGAFLCQNIWDYFAFTQDLDYLEKTGWPILKGAAEFWVDNLQETVDGHLAVSPSYSPEHGPLSDGAYYQTMIVWDLFSNCIQATEVLGKDHDFAEELKTLRDRLQPPSIGEYGQLAEWRNPALDKKANKDKHRHVSHMYAIYPGRQIIPAKHGQLANAAVQSMNFRGDAATGWSMGWKINIWARLLDGDRAMKLIGNFISDRVYPNLWCAHPPFQIDGNFGYSAGVAEMLLQSHTDEIVILPSLPKAWANGSVKGLCARGGVTVDLGWKDGSLVSMTVHSQTGTKCRIRYMDKVTPLKLKPGETVIL